MFPKDELLALTLQETFCLFRCKSDVGVKVVIVADPIAANCVSVPPGYLIKTVYPVAPDTAPQVKVGRKVSGVVPVCGLPSPGAAKGVLKLNTLDQLLLCPAEDTDLILQ